MSRNSRGPRASRLKMNPNFAAAAGPVAVKSEQKIYAAARSTGHLKLMNRGIKEFPMVICNLLDQENIAEDEKWWELQPLKTANLSNNEIPNIPEEIGQVAELQVLEMAHNCLVELPQALCTLLTLHKLDVSDNRLQSLPVNIGDLVELTELFAQHNKLRQLPASISSMRGLQYLNLDDNQLSYLPDDIGRGFVSLRKLSANRNRLESLPRSIGQLRKLEHLECGFNSIRDCPDLSQLKSLLVLRLENNKLQDLPVLPSGKTLAEVHISCNNIQSLDTLQTCEGLKVLVMRENGLREVPTFLASFPMQIVDVGQNNLNDVPSEFGRCYTLKKLVLDGNFLRKMNRGAVEKGITELKRYLRKRMGDDDEIDEAKHMDLVSLYREAEASGVLNAAGRNWVEVEPEAVEMSLKEFVGSANPLRRFPPVDLSYWAPQMRRLTIDGCGLRELGDGIGNLRKLQYLSVQNNKLTDLPDVVGRLTSLSTLLLGQNRFQEVPAAAIALRELEHLGLGYNAIRHIPDLTSMLHLDHLDVSNNQIESVEEGIRQNRALTILNLQNNNISQVPLELGLMEGLKTLMLAGNNIKTIPQAVIGGGLKRLQEHIRRKIPRDSPLLKEWKQAEEPPVDSFIIGELQAKIEDVQEQLEDFSITSAKKYALKKELARHKAQLIREKRKLQQK